VLLAAAGLLIQSFIRMQRLDYGYDPRGMAIMTLPQPAENRQLFTDQVMERIKATPGIESAAIVSSPSFGGLNFPFNIEGEALPAGDAPGRYSSVSTGYFRTIKARWIAGREFDERDSANAPAVAVVNETLATQFFRGANPIGRKVVIAYANQRIPREIIGVVGDIRQDGPRESVKPEVFVHWPQQPWIRANLLIRTNQDPSGVANAVQQSISTVDKTLPRSTFQTVEAMLGDRVAEPRLYMILFGAFAAVSVSLAIIGIYGLLSYIVNLRMYEMSIRIAIGARTPEIIRSVVGEGLRLSIAGIAFGLIGAVALTRLMRNLLFGVMPADPLTLSIVTLLLAFVALTACYIPARRAAKADPMAALRQE
jgi:putative ABC transport system permease protein